MNDFENIFLNQINEIVQKFDKENISNFVNHLKDFKEKKGRLFFCGLVVVPAIHLMQLLI